MLPVRTHHVVTPSHAIPHAAIILHQAAAAAMITRTWPHRAWSHVSRSIAVAVAWRGGLILGWLIVGGP